jgi:hypothetical protein
VKSAEEQCPFCGVARSCDEQPPKVKLTGRRLKAMAMTAALGMNAACGATTTAEYGAVEIPDAGDAGKDAPGDSTTDSPMGQTLYGVVAPPDAGTGNG